MAALTLLDGINIQRLVTATTSCASTIKILNLPRGRQVTHNESDYLSMFSPAHNVDNNSNICIGGFYYPNIINSSDIMLPCRG